MKFVMMPLLIIGMFISFIAAVVAMLFFTKKVERPQQLIELWQSVDSTRLKEEFRPKGFSIDSVLQLGTEYNTLYEDRLQELQEKEDSLAAVQVKLVAKADSLANEEAVLRDMADSTLKRKREENIEDLVKLMNALKPSPAAEILQSDEGLSDTMRALILKKLDPTKAAKIMGEMNTENAAHLTKIIQDL